MIKSFGINSEGNDYVVGDIHGCFNKLQERLISIGFDEGVDRLFSVGDLVDRGPESEDVLEWLDRPWFHAVRGNHEQMAINFMKGHNSALHYKLNGGEWFLNLDEQEQEAYVARFEELPYMIEVKTEHGTAGIVHAEVPNNDWIGTKFMIAKRDRKNSLLWDRHKFDTQNETVVKGIDRVYVGHTPLKQIVRLGNVHYIDGGAVFKGGQLFVVNVTEDMKDVEG